MQVPEYGDGKQSETDIHENIPACQLSVMETSHGSRYRCKRAVQEVKIVTSLLMFGLQQLA